MKNLKDVLEKLKVDDITLTSNLPINTSFKNIAKYLEDNGYKVEETTSYLSAADMARILNLSHTKCAIIYNFTRSASVNYALCIANTAAHPISEFNPAFYMISYTNSDKNTYYLITGCQGKTIKSQKLNMYEWLEELERHLHI